MARTVGIDREEVFETANRLEAEGKEVTALAMLAALGRGSLTTIYKYLDAWKDAKPVKAPIVQADQPEPVKTAFATAWRVAAEEAARETMVIRDKATEDTNAALRQFHGALEAIAKLETDRETDADAIDGLHKITAEQKAEIAKLESEAASEKARADELREQLKTLQVDRDAALKDAASLKGQLSQERKSREKESEEHKAQLADLEQKAEQAKEAHAKELRDMRIANNAAMAEAKSIIDEAGKERDEAKASAEEARHQKDKAEAAAKADRVERDKALQDKAELKGLSDALKDQNKQLLDKIGGDEKPQKKPKP